MIRPARETAWAGRGGREWSSAHRCSARPEAEWEPPELLQEGPRDPVPGWPAARPAMVRPAAVVSSWAERRGAGDWVRAPGRAVVVLARSGQPLRDRLRRGSFGRRRGRAGRGGTRHRSHWGRRGSAKRGLPDEVARTYRQREDQRKAQRDRSQAPHAHLCRRPVIRDLLFAVFAWARRRLLPGEGPVQAG